MTEEELSEKISNSFTLIMSNVSRYCILMCDVFGIKDSEQANHIEIVDIKNDEQIISDKQVYIGSKHILTIDNISPVIRENTYHGLIYGMNMVYLPPSDSKGLSEKFESLCVGILKGQIKSW